MGAGLVIAVDLNHDIVASRVYRPVSNSQGTFHTQAMARLLASLRTNPGLAQFEAWLHKEPEPLPGIFDVLLSSIYIMQARMTQASLRHDKPDILIRPPLGAVRFMEFDRAEEIIEIGYRSAAQQLARWAGAPTDD
jgi:NTE family protein